MQHITLGITRELTGFSLRMPFRCIQSSQLHRTDPSMSHSRLPSGATRNVEARHAADESSPADLADREGSEASDTHRAKVPGSASQTERALLGLRELIVEGHLQAGARISELWVVERLGVSRTPVRAALIRLQDEGLLEPIASGGFAVRSFTVTEIGDSIELRGTLEGLAARLAAERGVDPAHLQKLHQCVDEIDTILAVELTDDTFGLRRCEPASTRAACSRVRQRRHRASDRQGDEHAIRFTERVRDGAVDRCERARNAVDRAGAAPRGRRGNRQPRRRARRGIDARTCAHCPPEPASRAGKSESDETGSRRKADSPACRSLRRAFGGRTHPCRHNIKLIQSVLPGDIDAPEKYLVCSLYAR